MKWISYGPRHQVIQYNAYDINGCRYRTKSCDGRINQNSGVSIEATGMHVASAKDNNPVIAKSCYYGVIQEIWLLDYHLLRIPIFKCDWVDSAHGIRKDPLGYTLVELDRLGHKNDPFILASQARQVFYVKDQLDPKWWIVLSTPLKDYTNIDNVDEALVDKSRHVIDNVLPDIDSFDIDDDSETSYFRHDGQGLFVDTNAPNN